MDEEERSAIDGEEIRLYASHHQFYVQDSEPRSTAGDPTFWTKEAAEDRLAIGHGLLAVGTGTYDFVKVASKSTVQTRR
jgi:hypothetical protein